CRGGSVALAHFSQLKRLEFDQKCWRTHRRRPPILPTVGQPVVAPFARRALLGDGKATSCRDLLRGLIVHRGSRATTTVAPTSSLGRLKVSRPRSAKAGGEGQDGALFRVGR